MAKVPTRTNRPARKAVPTLTLDITHSTEDGLGIGRHGFKEALVAGAFPGEQVTATIEHEGQRRIICRLRGILKASADRITSPCRKAAQCQGCLLISMAYPAQLRSKEAKVRAALAAQPTLGKIQVLPIRRAEQPLGYRTNVKLAMAKVRGKVIIGLYRRGSHEVVDIGDCPLHHPLINRIVAAVREEVERQGVFVYDPRKQRGLLRYLAIRVSPGTGRAMVTFVTSERNFREVTHLGKWLLKKVPEIISVQQNVNSSEGNVIFGRETLKMLGTADLLDQVGEVRLRIAPTSFFQVNHEQAAAIYALVRQWAGLNRQETAVDLYCGIGGIALHLAKDAGRVIGIELAEEAVQNARQNSKLNGLSNCDFFAGDAAQLLEDLSPRIPTGSVVVLNPPRSGCEEEVLQTLATLQPRTIIYVSCNPLTLARDLRLLHTLGYRAEEVQPVDMFPQTPHVEAVVRLVQKKGDRK
jgi:23S rRNA (uracil1939-C5)-methyltransferase